MNVKIKVAFALTTGFFFLIACGNDTTTAKNSTDTASTSIVKTDTVDKKTSMGDTMQMDNGLMGAMNKMMDKMTEMQMSEDFDMDFANMMVEHHQGAIDMSQVELNSGKDEKMKAMAQKIITMQKDEQGKLTEIIKSSKPMKRGGEKHDELSKETERMKADMGKMQMSGNMDKDFAMMMVSHHESAIKMSKDELSHGMDTNLKQIAKKGIEDQSKEISEFKSWMSSNK